MSLLIIIILVLLLLGALPTYPYSRDWGPVPGGAIGVILVIVIILLVLGKL